MTSTRSSNLTLFVSSIALVLDLSLPLTAYAAGGGGGGTPSGSSAPRRDTTAEFNQHYLKGLNALNDQEYKTAVKSLKKATRLKKKHGNARAYLGIAQVGIEDYKAAQKSLEKAIKNKTDVPQAWSQLGLIYLHFNERDKAEVQLEVLEEMRSSCTGTCSNAANVSAAYDQLANALGTSEDGAANSGEVSLLSPHNPDPDDFVSLSYARAVLLINKGHYDDAIEILAAARLRDPHNTDVLTYLGFSHRKLRDFDTAYDYYQQALAIDPNHVGANEYLGEMYVEMGLIEKASNQLTKLDNICAFSCAEYDDLKALIDNYKERPHG